jgi:hypothetical protein
MEDAIARWSKAICGREIAVSRMDGLQWRVECGKHSDMGFSIASGCKD